MASVQVQFGVGFLAPFTVIVAAYTALGVRLRRLLLAGSKTVLPSPCERSWPTFFYLTATKWAATWATEIRVFNALVDLPVTGLGQIGSVIWSLGLVLSCPPVRFGLIGLGREWV